MNLHELAIQFIHITFIKMVKIFYKKWIILLKAINFLYIFFCDSFTNLKQSRLILLHFEFEFDLPYELIGLYSSFIFIILM